jgi:hypothetical protein
MHKLISRQTEIAELAARGLSWAHCDVVPAGTYSVYVYYNNPDYAYEWGPGGDQGCIKVQ